jgi:enterochelin esterase family protein
MIMVMPQGHALQGAGVGPLYRIPGETTMFSDRFPKDLLDEIIPLVEHRYRVIADADHRAIAGLSMGGGQSLTIGLMHPELFHYVLGYSAALGARFTSSDDVLKQLAKAPAAFNAKVHLVWVSAGRQDFLHQADKDFAEALTAEGIKTVFHETEGAHVWSVWRNNLYDTAPMLFNTRQ